MIHFTFIFSLLTLTIASDAMERRITLSDPYDHDQISFKIGGIIELAQNAKVCFGSPALTERINYAGIQAYPHDLLVPVKVLIAESKTSYVDWTRETPLCIKKPILEIAGAEIQNIETMHPKSNGKFGIEERRKSAIRKDALSKIQDLVFPPAIPVRHLEATHCLSAKAFGDCVCHRLFFDHHAELSNLINAQTFDILSIHDRDIQEKTTSLEWLKTRSIANNNADGNDESSLEQYIDKLEMDIEEASMNNIYDTAEYLQDNNIIAADNSVIHEETEPQFTITPRLITYANPIIIPGPLVQIDTRERALNHHNIKRPFDLVMNRQIKHEPQFRKRRLI
jgi:hypothetical protein